MSDLAALGIQAAPGAVGALAGSLVSWLSMKPRVMRLERQVRALLRVQLAEMQRGGLAPEQRALVEAVLADGADTES